MPPQLNTHLPTSSADWTTLSTSPTSHPSTDVKQSIRTSASPVASNTLQPPNAASPAFSFDDYLTPEFSSENPYSEQSHETTPNPDDLWNDDYKFDQPLSSHEPHLIDNSGHDTYFLSSAHNAFETIHNPISARSSAEHLTAHNIALMTPEMSTASMTPERSIRPGVTVQLTPNQLDAAHDSPMFERSRQRASSEVRAQSTGAPSSAQKRRADEEDDHLFPQVVSPVVMVSTYNRGDSPARPQIPLSRSNSKRSQSSRLGQQTDAGTEQDLVSASSRLMPPKNVEHEQWDEDEAGDQRAGIAPGQRNDDFVPSANDLERQRELDEKNTDVEHWLATSTAGTPVGSDDEGRSYFSRKNRIRSRSTGARVDATGLQIFNDSHIPGPGVLIDEQSNYYYSENEGDSVRSDQSTAGDIPESPPAAVDAIQSVDKEEYFPNMDEDIAPEDDEPLPRQFVKRAPWEDPARGLPTYEKGQPASSNAAIVLWQQRAAKFDTASRAATWGTRRLSDSEIGSILDGSSMTRHLSLKDTFTERARARGTSFINSAKKGLLGRSASFRKHSKQPSQQTIPEDRSSLVASPEQQPQQPAASSQENKHRSSIGSSRHSTLQRISSRGKSKPPKSPPLNTGSAFMAMTAHLSAVGGSSAHVPQDSEPLRSPLLSSLKRMRSKSDVSKSPKPSQGLSQLFTKNAGPTAPLLASPLPMAESSPKASAEFDDDMEDDETGVKMDLPVQTLNIIPTLEGFKTHARQLNPRLDAYLIERIGHDQLKRFKRLVKNKVDHTRAVQASKCSSAEQCLSLGGKANILPPRTNGKDSLSNFAQFKVAAGGDSDNDESSFVEGVVTPALFPPGIPLPPTTHLPAEFECPLCFQVKKFQKPSDWTKHVHEDVQPFSCTFPSCPEPKSFKRKADWVRHENERHRHLEWWKCSVQECAHVCYRKDNFVQHLVREHKMTEPKGKGSKSSAVRARSLSRPTQSGQSHGDFWQLVDSCRKETSLTPRNEPCKFCGNVCNSWKKLSVHVGKHMEQIAMPVLTLADCQKVSADTIISPVEPLRPQTFATTSIDANALGLPDQFPHSPYTSSMHSTYQGSSAGHSPVRHPANPQILPEQMTAMNTTFYGPNVEATNISPMVVPAQRFTDGQGMTPQYPYDHYGHMPSNEYMSSTQQGTYTQAPMNHSMTTSYPSQHLPLTQPMKAQYETVPGMQDMRGTGYDHQQSPAQFFAHTSSTNGTYMGNYGQEMAHQSDPLHAGHGSHGHTPGPSGHLDNTMPYFNGQQQAGPSHPGYY